MYADYHIHSTFCDGKDSLEDIVKEGVKRNVDEIGILHHAHVAFDPECSITQEGIEVFKSEMDFLKEKYKKDISIKKGVEMDYYSDEDPSGFDYVIGSVHYLFLNGKYYPIDLSSSEQTKCVEECFGGDFYQYTGKYFELVKDVVEKTKCTIIGHFDLVSKFNEKEHLFNEQDERYISQWKDAVDCLLKYDIPFEINTGAISRGYKTIAYPAFDMIEYIREKGGKFILSSDAHRKENICFKFDEYKKFI